MSRLTRTRLALLVAAFAEDLLQHGSFTLTTIRGVLLVGVETVAAYLCAAGFLLIWLGIADSVLGLGLLH